MGHTTITLLLFLLPLAYSPGPGNLFFAGLGARFGVLASVPASAGYHLATWGVTFAIGYGLMEILQRFPIVFYGMRYAGAAYVFWLGALFLRAGRIKGAPEARPAGFWDGVILMVLNPKAYVIIALMFTQFLRGEDAGFLVVLVLITTVFTLNNLVAFAVWTALGDVLGRLFRSEAQARVLNTGFGCLLVAVAIWLLIGGL